MSTEEAVIADKKGEGKSAPIQFMPYACENSPAFNDIDKAVSLMPSQGIQHRQREIWKMAPKKNDKGITERDDKTGAMIMVKAVTRNSKFVTVNKTIDGGLVSTLKNGAIEPMDFTDVREVIELLNK